MRAWKLASSLGARLLPRACLLCDQACGDEPLCIECRSALPGIDRRRCPACAMPGFGHETGFSVCPTCRASPPRVSRMTVVADYASPLAEAITALKFGQQVGLAIPMGQLLAQCIAKRDEPSAARSRTPGMGVGALPDETEAPPDCLVPIPLSNRRLAERGFNQAQLIAAAVRRRWIVGPKSIGPRRPALRPDLLARSRDTAHQSGLRRAQRRVNLESSFVASPQASGLHIALVDDVVTTGATLDAAANALLRAGAASVIGYAVARTP